MRSWPEDLPPGPAAPPDLDSLIAEGRWGDTTAALRRLEAVLPDLEHSGDPDLVLLGLYGRVQLQRLSGVAPADVLPACDTLERAAVEHRYPVLVATAAALRAGLRMEDGDAGAALADLARVDLDQLGESVDGAVGARLLDVLATTFARLRLLDRHDDVRGRLDGLTHLLQPVARATHWAGWATELAGRALEPVAAGRADPDDRLLDRAVEVAERVGGLDGDAVPPRLRRTVDGVCALAAAYQGRPAEALRLLGQDAFGDPRDLADPLGRQLVRLAAMHAHALVGSVTTARSLDDAGHDGPAALPHLVLEVCRARERFRLESEAGGDVVPVLHRLTDLLVRLSWQGMELVTDAARQTLEHQALHTESRTDPLTGAGNRRALDEDLRQLLRFSPLPVSLVLADIDDFKGVNDSFTPVVGDEVLRRVATSLQAQLRVGDRLLRYGGDEFVVLLPHTGDQEARRVARRITDAIGDQPWDDLAEGLEVQITTGCAALWSLTGRRPERDAEQLFRRADEALLDAKRARADGADSAPWPTGGRRVALREAPGPTLAPPDREPARSTPSELRPPVDDEVPTLALSPVAATPAYHPRWRSTSPATPPTGALEALPAALRDGPELVTDLLDTAETMDEAVSHVTAPGVPVITASAVPESDRRPARPGPQPPPWPSAHSDLFAPAVQTSEPSVPYSSQPRSAEPYASEPRSWDPPEPEPASPARYRPTGPAPSRHGRRALGPPTDGPDDAVTPGPAFDPLRDPLPESLLTPLPEPGKNSIVDLRDPLTDPWTDPLGPFPVRPAPEQTERQDQQPDDDPLAEPTRRAARRPVVIDLEAREAADREARRPRFS